MVISSLVIRSKHELLSSVKAEIEKLPNTEVVEAVENKFAVVLETETTEAAADLANNIQSINGVTAVQLISHFFEDEVKKE